MMQLSIIQTIISWAIPVLFAITVHEVAHGWTANKLGDKTALIMGRITLNPLKHIDPIGTILVPIALLFLSHYRFVFGWAKPVPVNFNNLRKPRRDMALVAVAGPASNFLMVIIWAFVAKMGFLLFQNGALWAQALAFMGQIGVMINLLLMMFNLIPIPPLDGSRIVTAMLSPRAAFAYNKLERYQVAFILLGVLWITGGLNYIFIPVWWMFGLIRTLIGF